jgi:hypothetical protein
MINKNWDTPLRDAIRGVLADYGAEIHSGGHLVGEFPAITDQATEEVMEKIWDWMTDGSEASLPRAYTEAARNPGLMEELIEINRAFDLTVGDGLKEV